MFETCDVFGVPVGLLPRERVHRRGSWHKAAHVLLLRSTGELWLQQRSPDKDIGAGLWDFSVGEHLQPGERFVDGAHRGLREELGVEGVRLTPLGGMGRFAFVDVARGILDRELQQTFVGWYDGGLVPDAVEVAAVRHLSLSVLADEMESRPGDFTPWLHQGVKRIGLLAPGYIIPGRPSG